MKKLEKDMEEFKDNKEGKIDELKVIFNARIATETHSEYRLLSRSKSPHYRS